MERPVRLAVATDEGYLKPTAACVRSVIDTLDPDHQIEVAVISHELSDTSQERLRASWSDASCRVTFVEDAEWNVSRLPFEPTIQTWLTPASYSTLFLGRILPPDWTRVVYLDSDTITRRSISPLYFADLDGAAIGAVRDEYVPTVASTFGVQRWSSLGMDPEMPYLNSGVMVVDLTAWRTRNVEEHAVDYVLRYRDDIAQTDQEALNAAVLGNWVVLDRLWNVSNYWRRSDRRVGEFSTILTDAKIRHFAGPFKPWDNDPELPDSDIYHRCLNRTFWRSNT
jgi:lipopolysaccharide biosynthesis glycosyltransferase